MKEVKIKMVVDSSDAVKNVDNLNEALDETTASQKDVANATKKTTDAQNKAKKSTQRNQAAFEGMNKATGGAIGGIRALIKQMWLLVANPIGLVIAAIALALTSLYKAFTSTKAGGEAFDQVMAGISATIDVVRDRVLVIGEALVKFFTGDFKGAMETGKKAVAGFGAEVAAEFKIAAEAKRDLQEVVDTMRLLSISRAELDRDLIKAKETIESSTASYEEKKKAIDEVRIAETKQTELELASAKKKLEAIKAQNAQSDSGAEDLDKEAQARIAVINLEKVSSSNKTKFAKLQEMADRDEEARIKSIQATRTAAAKQKELEDENERKRKETEDKANEAAQKVKDDAEKARLKSLSDFANLLKKQNEDLDAVTAEEKLQLQRERATAELNALIGTETEKREALLALNKLYDQKEADLADKVKVEEDKNDKLKKQNAQSVTNAKIQIASTGLDVLGSLAKEGSELSKGIAVAQTSINTYQGITAALAAETTIPEPFGQALKVANAVAVGVSGLMNVKKILATKPVERTAPNVGGVGGTGGASAPSFNLVEGSADNQIQNSIQNSGNKPLRAFVVAQDVTTQQSLDRQIEQNAGV